MINSQLLNPRSIVVVGGSDDTSKPGGKVLKNIIDGNFKGDLFVINLKADEVQGVKSYNSPEAMPDVDLQLLQSIVKQLSKYWQTISQQVLLLFFLRDSARRMPQGLR